MMSSTKFGDFAYRANMSRLLSDNKLKQLQSHQGMEGEDHRSEMFYIDGLDDNE